jgi:hypothetical protein
MAGHSSGSNVFATSTIGAAGVVNKRMAASFRPSADGSITANGFAGRCLRAQMLYRRLPVRVTRQMKTANTFYRDDPAGFEQRNSCLQGFFSGQLLFPAPPLKL